MRSLRDRLLQDTQLDACSAALGFTFTAHALASDVDEEPGGTELAEPLRRAARSIVAHLAEGAVARDPTRRRQCHLQAQRAALECAVLVEQVRRHEWSLSHAADARTDLVRLFSLITWTMDDADRCAD